MISAATDTFNEEMLPFRSSSPGHPGLGEACRRERPAEGSKKRRIAVF